jgi:poly(hydroxyalkanoate) depolymerase family esterase
MTMNTRLLAHMRAATRSLIRRGPSVAKTMMQESMKTAKAMQGAGHANVAQAASPAGLDPFSDMLADLSRFGQAEGNPFNAPPVSSGVAMVGLPGQFIDGSYTDDNGSRDYKLYVPSTYVTATTAQTGAATPAPLLVMLHGCSQNPDDFAVGTGMNALAEEWRCLVVYPSQAQAANASRCWNWFNAVDQQRGQGEPAILAGLTRDIMARYAIDPRQVYVAGMSAGGAMAAILGTQYPELYAAVGVHSGLPFAAAHDLPSALAAMKGDFKRRQAAGRSLPIIVFHGDRDTTVHPANGEELIRHRHRHPQEAVAVEPGSVPNGHAYTRTLHRRPDGKVHAEHWVVHDAGHAWFGGDARGTYTDGKGPDASREMMRFFRTAV